MLVALARIASQILANADRQGQQEAPQIVRGDQGHRRQR